MIGKLKGRLMTGSQLADQNNQQRASMLKDTAFTVGRVVSHPQYGSGRIIAASGRGPNVASLSISFPAASKRDFRLSHAQLSIES